MRGGHPMTERELVERAFSMLERSYVPYSHFPVGAALECADGSVFTGCNVENAAYGSTICAERTAAVKAVSEGHRDDFVRIAIVGNSTDYCWPCGACRQFLFEFAPDLECLIARGDHEYVKLPLRELLAHGFGPKSLL
ncbi:cytidine deaminase [Intestinimonas timonensis]|uniref:cytidine deaminase n=2 Tax=Intestinimonas timonensis TaxID=1689270 RepID=UPI0030FE95D1